MSRQIRPGDFGADVHSAGQRSAGAALCADRQDRGAQRAEESVDGYERRFCDRDSIRRDPCAGWVGDLRTSLGGPPYRLTLVIASEAKQSSLCLTKERL